MCGKKKRKMTISHLYRISGLGILIGTITFIVPIVLRSLVTAGIDPSTFAIGIVTWLAGSVLLAVPFLRKRVQPTWVGYTLVASGVWMVIGNLFIAPRCPDTNPVVNLLSNLGPVLLLIGIAYLGYRMLSEHYPTVVKNNSLTKQ